MVRFEIGGRRVSPNKLGDAIMSAVLKGIESQIRERVGSIRDPETGEFPTVVVRGESLESLKMTVEGSPAIIALVRERLDLETGGDEIAMEETVTPPCAFLSYTSDNVDLAKRIAEALQANGIETWWDRWCIGTGDSLRQKIDEGLAGCTHFLVLLTPESIGQPWVNQEMDAGLVRKLRNECRFLPVRYKLPASALPPLLSGMHAPEIAADDDITQFINDIHGISRKPALGPAPVPVANAPSTGTGYSPAATSIARLFVERTKHALFADPQFSLEELAAETGLTVPDVKDGLYELSEYFKDNQFRVLVKSSLFAAFDKYWKPWNPAEDALKLAADMANDPEFPAECRQIAERYGWEARRLNPAVSYLFERGMLVDYNLIGASEFELVRVVGKEDAIRRFVKSRQ